MSQPTVRHPALTLGPKQLEALANASTSKHKVVKDGLAQVLRAAPVDYKPMPLARVDIGPYGKGVGHNEFVGDSMQAWLQALAWVATRNAKHAHKSREIVLAWSRACTAFEGANAPLEAAWGAPCLVRAVELLKHPPGPDLNAAWTLEDSAYFDSFLDRIIMPNLLTRYQEVRRWQNNWVFTIIEALIQVALYRDDMKKARELAKEFSDLLHACVKPCGCNTENTRDMVHCQFQVASQVQIAEMLFHQGIDAYDPLIHKTLEYQASILTGTVPPELSPTDIKDNWFMPGAWEAGYNHFATRRKMDMPHTTRLLTQPQNRPERHSFNWGPGWLHYLTY